jgi:hypothetical protein
MESIVAGVLIFALFLGPLVARVLIDRRAERAAVIAADLRAVARRRLGGESMLSIDVRPGAVWAPGRVVLSAPRGYEWLIEAVWPLAASRVPDGCELVVRGWARPTSRVAPAPAAPLSRAA